MKSYVSRNPPFDFGKSGGSRRDPSAEPTDLLWAATGGIWKSTDGDELPAVADAGSR
jgi:hypothetical protein